MERQREKERCRKGRKGGGQTNEQKDNEIFFVAWATISQRQQVHVRQQVGIVNGIGDEIWNGNRNVYV